MILLTDNPFDRLDIGRGLISNDVSLRGTISSAYYLIMVIGLTGIVISLMIAAIKLGYSRPGTRAEAFNEIKWKLIIAIALSSMVTLAGWIMSVAANLV